MTILYFLMEKGIFSTYWMMIYCLTTYEMLLATFFFCGRLKKRKHFYLYGISVMVALFGISIGMGYLRSLWPENVMYRMSSTLLQYLFGLGLIFACYEERPTSVLLNWIGALAVREIGDAGFTLLMALTGQNPHEAFQLFPDLNLYFNLVLWDLVHWIIVIPLALVFSRYQGQGRDEQTVRVSVLLSLIIIVATVILKTLILQRANESNWLYLCAVSQTLLMCIIVLILRTDVLLGSQAKQEVLILNQVLVNEKKQYKSTRESISIINSKVHDIKHALDKYGDKIASDDLTKLKESVNIYDKQFHTGSEVLDTILYSKSLTCNSLGIRLTCLADGTCVHFLKSSERYYLFSNILDNAIEAVENLPDSEKRIISLNVYKEDDMVHIESSNYFSGARNVKDGFFETTKKDSKNHGYGLRSIKMLTEEHNGTLDVNIKEDMFYLTILIPFVLSKKDE